MAHLPNMKYAGSAQRAQNIVFKGINLSDTASDGELIACENLSANRFPFLSARGGRKRKGTYEKAAAAFIWNGHEVVAEDGKLLYDGQALCNCSPGAKQFAVVNTKLVVWPDKLVIDMTDKTFRKLDALLTNNGAAEIYSNEISFEPRMVYASLEYSAEGKTDYMPYLWTYESVSWDDEEGWTLNNPRFDMIQNSTGRYYIPDVEYNKDTGEYIVSLPDARFAPSYDDVTEPFFEEPAGNDKGFYCKLIRGNTWTINYVLKMIRHTQYIEAYWSEQDNDYDMEATFSVGDRVNIGGSLYNLIEGENLTVQSVDTQKRTLTFEKDSLRPIRHVYEIEEDVPNDGEGPMVSMTLTVGSVIISVEYESDEGWRKGDVICIETDGEDIYSCLDSGEHDYSIYLWKPQERIAHSFWNVDAWIDYKGIDTEGFKEFKEYNAERLTVRRVAYDFDFICEKDNRLWGVCNRQKDSTDGARGRLIMASALGNPTEFDKFEGLSTDSWQVAVAGDGDFTACCNYGDSVLFFKEDKLYKIAGDLPEQYTLYTYNVAGVQNGCSKSIVNINETLFYKGVAGVYAFGGGVPSLISTALGRDRYYNACAGSDGVILYISMKDEQGNSHLFTYDSITGLWLREDNSAADDFCFSSGQLLMLTGGKLYHINSAETTDDGEDIKWSATLAPMSEASDHNRRCYSRLLIRLKDSNGRGVYIFTAKSNGAWKTVKMKKLSNEEYIAPLPPNRDNDLRIKIEGVAPCSVVSVAREYIGGSELGGVHK